MESHPCNKCGITIINKDKFMKCDSCNRSYHLECENVSVHKYEYLHSKDNIDLLWICSLCRSNNEVSHRHSNRDELITSIKRVITEQTARIDSKLTEHNQKVQQKIGTELMKIKNDLRLKCDTTVVDTLIKELEKKQN